jgi:hypothetical protein
MGIETERLLPILVQGGSFIAAFAAITAGVIMASVTKKFGTGLLASGFKNISTGVILIAGGIILDALNSYLQLNSAGISFIMLFAKDLLFVLGTYIIVIASKKTADKLESLTK